MPTDIASVSEKPIIFKGVLLKTWTNRTKQEILIDYEKRLPRIAVNT